MAKFIIDTSDLDEAIVKAKILNEELEKAKTQINSMTNCTCNLVSHGSISVIAENLKPIGLKEEDIDSMIRTIREQLLNDKNIIST